MEDDQFFALPDIATELVNVDNSGLSDEEKLKSPVVLGGAPITHQQSAPALKKIVHSWT